MAPSLPRGDNAPTAESVNFRATIDGAYSFGKGWRLELEQMESSTD
ncbi:hypothetical protein OG422_02000 [Streptomyces sp. NBC_01525]